MQCQRRPTHLDTVLHVSVVQVQISWSLFRLLQLVWALLRYVKRSLLVKVQCLQPRFCPQPIVSRRMGRSTALILLALCAEMLECSLQILEWVVQRWHGLVVLHAKMHLKHVPLWICVKALASVFQEVTMLATRWSVIQKVGVGVSFLYVLTLAVVIAPSQLGFNGTSVSSIQRDLEPNLGLHGVLWSLLLLLPVASAASV
jgi:hypothetical protein